MTRMNRFACWIIAVITLIGLAILYAGNPMYAGLWHMTHGDYIRCGDRLVPVPSGWYGTQRPCGIDTASPLYTMRIPFRIELNVNPTSAAPRVQDSKWRRGYVNRLQSDGNVVTGSSDLTVADLPTACFEWHGRAKNSYLMITCNVDKDAVIVFIYNDPKWKPVFYGILSRIR